MPVDDDEVSLDDDAESDAPRRSVLASIFMPRTSGRVTDPELRERMRTLDPQERKYAWIVAAISLLEALLLVPTYLLHNTKTAQSEPQKTEASCRYFGFTWDAATKACQHIVISHPSDWVLTVTLSIALSLILLFAIWRSIRSLVIFTMFFDGLVAARFSLLFIIFIMFGVWLLVRSFRLQRFGTTNAAEMRRISAERAAARKEERARVRSGGPTDKPAIQPSKRYTPKSKPRRR